MPLSRRRFAVLAAIAPWTVRPASAHHGWSGFDQERPLYLEGTVVGSKWQNPHAELMIELPAGLKLPSDLARRPLPAQTAAVDGPGLLARATLPRRSDRRWELELAPLTRLDAWKVAEIRVGARVSAIGYASSGEQGDAVMRVEYLFVGDKAYGLRSSPA
ncbi:DUF6152 family protein [Rhizobacter sp. SG703]|uniref:DUF6152 family protein n=1 Tax=Rhizobacter sp. SG703 TaxID=2587140 RepID=UPI001445BD2C|nr:DUF6152 family protein [Rhizobacter sp. SG703]NKI97496.1 hypothetical protein [Rhizobacter sp. SG703]